MDGVRAHAELAGDHAERSTASDGSDHGPTAGGLTVSLVMVHLSRGRRFPSRLPAERSGCSVTQVFGMLCHLPPDAKSVRMNRVPFGSEIVALPLFQRGECKLSG